jgi:hypothetical protein
MSNLNRIALSIRQPWAWFIINGYKDIENRTWSTKYRGFFYVHAGLTFDEDGYDLIKAKFRISMPRPTEFERGGLIGIVKLIDCVTSHKSPWFEGPFGFILSDPQPIEFIRLAGRLRFFPVSIS